MEKELDMEKLNTGLVLINGYLSDLLLYIDNKHGDILKKQEKEVIELCRLLSKKIGVNWNEYIK